MLYVFISKNKGFSGHITHSAKHFKSSLFIFYPFGLKDNSQMLDQRGISNNDDGFPPLHWLLRYKGDCEADNGQLYVYNCLLVPSLIFLQH